MTTKEIWENYHKNKDLSALQTKELVYFLYKNYWNNTYGLEVLDLGCGQGHTCKFLDEWGFNVTGIDYSEEAIKKARKIGCKCWLGNIEKTPFTNDIFDLIICQSTLASLTDEEIPKVLKECRRILKPEGKIFFQELDESTPRDNKYLTRQGNIKMFNPKELADYFIDAGFKNFQVQSSGYHDINLHYVIAESTC